ncbi:hypothetical protein, partial [Pseudophaeobacter profundi]|uniref:hypothetical protein n=1 Tax=Pseudophaeobacter profundi TaxID=3034152 RepID=UPI00242F6F26
DSQVTIEGRLLDIVDDAWREDKLPFDDITVPLEELPDPDADNGDTHMTVKEAESKWNDLSLALMSEQQQSSV